MHLWPEADKVEYLEQKATRNRRPIDFWQPQSKQETLLEACGLLDALNGGTVKEPVCEVIGYGGAAFGGKTEGLLGIGLIAGLMIPGCKVGLFRRTFPELEGSDGPIERSQEIYKAAGAKYNNQKHVWNFGANEEACASVRFCHCQYENDVYDYQSAAFDILMFDEATHFSWFIVDYLTTRNRITKYSKIPRPFRVLTTNPGNIGHTWYMQIFGIAPGVLQK